MCVVMRAIGRPYILICPTYTKGHCETQYNGKKWDTTACSTRMPVEVAGDKEPTSYLTNFTERKCIMVSIVLWHHDRAIPRLLGWNRSMVVSKHCRNTCQTFMSLICLHSPMQLKWVEMQLGDAHMKVWASGFRQNLPTTVHPCRTTSASSSGQRLLLPWK